MEGTDSREDSGEFEFEEFSGCHFSNVGASSFMLRLACKTGAAMCQGALG